MEVSTTDAEHTAEADVVVVGAGPTGLITAILLGNRGHDVVVLEKYAEPYELPRAVGISHETLRILQVAQIVDAVRPGIHFTADGTRRRELCTADGEVLAVRFDQADSPSGWPERANFSQPQFERTLNALAVDHPRIRLLRSWNVTGVSTDSYGVKVTADCRSDQASGSLDVDARFVVGCDGANSVVRSGDLGGVTDLGFEFDWLVIDVELLEDLEFRPNFGQIFGPPRPTTVVASGTTRLRRWEFMRLDHETKDELNTVETAWRLLGDFNVTPANALLKRHAVYTFRASWADSWRSGHRLLAGDAAHLMPPFLGEGFNSGVRDALAAAWRLDLILRGVTSESILDSYSPERLGHVRQLVEQSVSIGRMICVVDPVEAEERNARLRAIESGHVPELAQRAWQLGPGIWRSDDPHGGTLGVQGRVTIDGTTGLLDDLIGGGRFVLMSVDGDPLADLSIEHRSAWERLGGLGVHIGDGTPVIDVDGTYTEWFGTHEIRLALFRPDFYVFATGQSLAEVPLMVSELLDQIHVITQTTQEV
jgi:resorcinol 4-hydroxylase (NADPH)